MFCTMLMVSYNVQGSNKKKSVKTIELTYEEFVKRVTDVSDDRSDWNYLGDKPAIVDFYADWCPPCRKIAPILDELAEEYDGQIYIYKVNVDKEPKLSEAFGIKNLPTLLYIPMGEKPQTVKGALPKASFKEAIDKVLLKK